MPVDGNQKLLAFNKGALGRREDHGTGSWLVPNEGQRKSPKNKILDENQSVFQVDQKEIPYKPFLTVPKPPKAAGNKDLAPKALPSPNQPPRGPTTKKGPKKNWKAKWHKSSSKGYRIPKKDQSVKKMCSIWP
ncbi:hypothetical protein O181_006089 [Austropuccinia psidii MF-1]|uniref:Uncharacterized protein n=1 Tax=Austropuccinia psidii MF-1 TaxID=1389203 RepID=A0A9Q3GGI2_9BASI|nr:hypothetical protein [Austropuccinia psidii MF-1]